MPALAIFGISSGGVDLAVKLLLLVLVAIWAALVFWTYSDARRRVEDPMLVGCAAAASLVFPYVGTIVYMIVRPPEYIEDIRERELEIAAAEARLAQAEQLVCPYCDFEIEKNFLRCPSCLRRLKEPCAACGRPLDPRWKICPYCEAEVAAAAPQQRRRPRRAGAGPPPSTVARPPAGAPVQAAPARPQAPGQGPIPRPPAPVQQPGGAPRPPAPAPGQGVTRPQPPAQPGVRRPPAPAPQEGSAPRTPAPPIPPPGAPGPEPPAIARTTRPPTP